MASSTPSLSTTSRYSGVRPNAQTFKTQTGQLAVEFANALVADMRGIADAIRSSTSSISAALGGAFVGRGCGHLRLILDELDQHAAGALRMNEGHRVTTSTWTWPVIDQVDLFVPEVIEGITDRADTETQVMHPRSVLGDEARHG